MARSSYLKGLLLAALAGSLVAQVSSQLANTKDGDKPQGPAYGEELPDVSLRLFRSGELASILRLPGRGDRCLLVVLASTSCPACARMRSDWEERLESWTHAANVRVWPVWLFASDVREVDRFFADHALSRIQVAVIDRDQKAVLRRFGAFGTPTLLLYDRNNRYVAGGLGDSFPPPGLVQGQC